MLFNWYSSKFLLSYVKVVWTCFNCCFEADSSCRIYAFSLSKFVILLPDSTEIFPLSSLNSINFFYFSWYYYYKFYFYDFSFALIFFSSSIASVFCLSSFSNFLIVCSFSFTTLFFYPVDSWLITVIFLFKESISFFDSLIMPSNSVTFPYNPFLTVYWFLYFVFSAASYLWTLFNSEVTLFVSSISSDSFLLWVFMTYLCF